MQLLEAPSECRGPSATIIVSVVESGSARIPRGRVRAAGALTSGSSAERRGRRGTRRSRRSRRHPRPPRRAPSAPRRLGTSSSATSTPSKTVSSRARTSVGSPRTVSVCPAERAEATSRISALTSARSEGQQHAPGRQSQRRPPGSACCPRSPAGASVDHGLVRLAVQPERGVDGTHGGVDVVRAGDHGDPDLGGRDQFDVDAGVGHASKKVAVTPGSSSCRADEEILAIWSS